jgi:tape measure domain-containing protein
VNIRELLIRIGVSTGRSGADLDRLDNRVNRVKGSFDALNGALALLAGAATLRSIIGIGDEMVNLQSQVGNATGDMAGAAAQMDVLSKHADDGRVAVTTYIGSWAKMMSGVKQFGGTADDTTKFMDTLSAAFVSNGTDTNTANAALFQLSQTMQGGQVQGEEMNSLIDAQGELYHDLAVEIGGSVINYKKMQAAGTVTSEMLLKAVNKFYDKYQGRVSAMPMTVTQAMTKISNQWKMGIAHMNQASPVITDIANMILMLGDKGSAAIGWLVDALGGAQAAITDLKWQIGGLVALFAGTKLIGILTNPFTYVIIAIVAAIAVVQDLVAWVKGDAESAFGQLFGNFEKYQHYIDDIKTGWAEVKKDFTDIVGVAQQLLTILKAIENSDISKSFGSLMSFLQNPGQVLTGGAKEPTGFANSQPKIWWDIMTRKINQMTGNEEGAPSRVPDMLAGIVNQPLTAANVPSRGATTIQNTNSGNQTNQITVVAQPGMSSEDIGKAVAGKIPRPAGIGTFNPESLMNYQGAK